MYDAKLKTIVGRLDRKSIPYRYANQVQFYQRSLARKQTKAECHFEERVAQILRDEGRAGYSPQKPFFITDQIAFIVDFHFPKFRAVIEIDGSSHYGAKNKEYDAWRDGVLKRYGGVDVLRLSNAFVLRHTNEAFNQVVRFLGERENATPYYRKHFRLVYSHYFDD